ncbi:hypothetical protein AB0K87_24385 [Streptomyces sp. NPDC053705]|uniref:hypothetical protein n=1 Tax=Streptomyces sp. NPDC053705 TaxID=3156668 RepID=UPI00343FCCE5
MTDQRPALDDDQLEAEPAACSNCGRPLKRPAVDELGPVCRRNLARAAAEQAQQ